MKYLPLPAVCRLFSVVLVVLAVSGLWPGLAQAQTRWLQNVELIAPVGEEHVTRALLDTLTYVIQDYDIALKQSAEDTDTLSYMSLENALWDKGLDFSSATHLFIGYRLEANQRRFNSAITHLFFIFRPPDVDGLDEPIFYVDATQPAIQRVLNNSGTASPLNEAAIVPFREQLTFHKLPESTLVSIGGRIIRDPKEAAAERERLMTTIRRFVFN